MLPGRARRGDTSAVAPWQVMTISPLAAQMLDWNMTGLSAITRALISGNVKGTHDTVMG
jgi:hypothetical protein